MVRITSRHAVVCAVDGYCDIEVLWPQHRLLVGGKGFQRVRTDAQAVMGPSRGFRVEVKHRTRRERGRAVVDPDRGADVDAGGRTKPGERSGELRAALWPHQFGALDGDRQHDPAESSWGHLKPDGAVAAVLRPHDEHLGHAVQLSGRPDVRVGLGTVNDGLRDYHRWAPLRLLEPLVYKAGRSVTPSA